MSKQVPLDSAVDRAARRRSGTRSRWRRTSSAAASRPASDATCSRWPCAACSPAISTRCRSCICSSSCAPTTASTSCSRSRKVRRRTSSKAVRARSRAASPRSSATPSDSNAPVRSISLNDNGVVVEAGDLLVTARHAVVTVPPALALEHRVRSGAARRPPHAVRTGGGRSRIEDTRRLRRAVLAHGRLQRPDRGAGFGRGGDHRRVAGERDARRHRVVHVRPGRGNGCRSSTRPFGARRWSTR